MTERQHLRTVDPASLVATERPAGYLDRLITKALAPTTPPTPRTCTVCGCTDDIACPGGCSWLPGGPAATDICTRCVPIVASPYVQRAIAAAVALEQQVARVLDLHIVGERVGRRPIRICKECLDPWPCPTVQALDPDQTRQE